MYTPSSTEEGALEEQERQRDTNKCESEPQNTMKRLLQKELVVWRDWREQDSADSLRRISTE